MKTFILALLAILSGSGITFAQDDGNVTLLAQSVDGKTVKLFWFIQHWNSSYTGFDVKRKEGLQNWVKLNPEPILPGISAKKKLTIAGLSRYEESILKGKQYRLLATHTLHETDYAKYLQKLNKDDSALREITPIMAEDYEIALLNGFGYIDHTLTKKTVYQYGLFIQGTDQLLAKVSWNYGEIPDLDVVHELTSKAIPGSVKGIKIYWSADSSKMKAAHVAGFNVYREGIRLNTTRITMADTADPSVYSWYDKYATNTDAIQYSIAAESIFDIEGIIKSYIYDPADHTKDYKKAEVAEIVPVGYYFKDGTAVKWNFPKEYERYLKGFVVEKDNVPAGYKMVSDILDPSMRSFTDKTPSQANGYIKVRVRAIYKDRTNVQGIERVFYYFPLTEPLPPQNLTVKSKFADKAVSASFHWDPPLAGDSVTDAWKLYTYDEVSEKFIPIDDHLINSSSYTYTIRHGIAGVRRFCVTALSKGRKESSFSDTVSVQVPTLELPAPVIKKVTPDDNNKALIEWQYPDIPDLKGFRLYQNNVLIANENELKKNARQFTTGKLDEGASYEFTINAVSDKDIISENSASFHVVVTQTSIK